MIKVKLFGILKNYMPHTDDEGYWRIDEETLTVAQVLERAGVSSTEFRYTILVNKVRKAEDYRLKDGDIMTVMPLVAGG